MTTAVPPLQAPSIRRAERADLLAVVRIENASFPQPWPYEAFDPFVGEPGFLVATEDDLVVGYVVADMTSTVGGVWGHVKDFAVHPTHRGQGIGSALLARALGTLTARGATATKLEVRESNAEAIDLYRSFDFSVSRRISGYYLDDEDALLMVRRAASG